MAKRKSVGAEGPAPKRAKKEQEDESSDDVELTPAELKRKQAELMEEVNALPIVRPVQIKKDNALNSQLSFDSLGDKIHPRLLTQLKYLGYFTMTKIQAVAIPRLADPQRPDGLIRGVTGGGKTLAFLVPVIHSLLQVEVRRRARLTNQGTLEKDDMKTPVMSRAEGTRALILSPTRELALQTLAFAEKLTQMTPWLTCGALACGARKKGEKAALRKGVGILVATPGRILDHLDTTSSFNCRPLVAIVIDEADRLMDLGFGAKLRRIITLVMEMVKGNVSAAVTQNPQTSVNKEILAAERQAQMSIARLIMQGKLTESEAAETEAETPSAPEPMDEKVVADLKVAASARKDCPKRVQTVIVSATLTNDIEKLADFCLDKKKSVWMGEGDFTPEDELGLKGKVKEEPVKPQEAGEEKKKGPNWNMPPGLKQAVLEVENLKHKTLTLLAMLLVRQETAGTKTLVFADTCETVDYLCALIESVKWPSPPTSAPREQVDEREKAKKQASGKLRKAGVDIDDFLHFEEVTDGVMAKLHKSEYFSEDKMFPRLKAYRLHGTMNKEDRVGALTEFSREATYSSVIFTTDVASRGLNFSTVDLVIQYDAPIDPCDYVHRVGRTARVGQPGKSVIFLEKHEMDYLKRLRQLNACPSGISPNSQSQFLGVFKPDSPKCLLPAELKHRVRPQDAANFIHARATMYVEQDDKLSGMAEKAFVATVKTYRTHTHALRSVFDIQKLHLGHLAGCFLLRRSPQEIARHEKTQDLNAIVGNRRHGKIVADYRKPASRPSRGGPRGPPSTVRPTAGSYRGGRGGRGGRGRP